MLFAIINTDRPGSLELRLTTRPAHLDYLTAHQACIRSGGALLDAEGRPEGSLLIVDLPDRTAADAFAAGDPYAKAGLFESSVIRPYREVFHEGAKIA
jgi:uncharacterized protein